MSAQAIVTRSTKTRAGYMSRRQAENNEVGRILKFTVFLTIYYFGRKLAAILASAVLRQLGHKTIPRRNRLLVC
jgi:hypothetical protein